MSNSKQNHWFKKLKASVGFSPTSCSGFTLLELLIVISIIGILASVGIPKIFDVLQKAEYAQATADVNTYLKNSTAYRIRNGNFPSSWEDLGYEKAPRDPWGNKYILHNHKDIVPGKRRSDGPTVPINSHLDIFSPGPDGSWQPSIWASTSQDDVIVAGDGSYVGKAENL